MEMGREMRRGARNQGIMASKQGRHRCLRPPPCGALDGNVAACPPVLPSSEGPAVSPRRETHPVVGTGSGTRRVSALTIPTDPTTVLVPLYPKVVVPSARTTAAAISGKTTICSHVASGPQPRAHSAEAGPNKEGLLLNPHTPPLHLDRGLLTCWPLPATGGSEEGWLQNTDLWGRATVLSGFVAVHRLLATNFAAHKSQMPDSSSCQIFRISHSRACFLSICSAMNYVRHALPVMGTGPSRLPSETRGEFLGRSAPPRTCFRPASHMEP